MIKGTPPTPSRIISQQRKKKKKSSWKKEGKGRKSGCFRRIDCTLELVHPSITPMIRWKLVTMVALLLLLLLSSSEIIGTTEETLLPSSPVVDRNRTERLLLTSTSKSSTNPREYLYPKTIRTVHVRRDVHSLHPVQRGLLPFLFSDSSRLHWLIDSAKGKNVTMKGGNEQKPSKIPLDKFRKTLQCAPYEPDVDDRSIWNLLQLAPPTIKSTEAVCAWVEFGLDCVRWDGCQQQVLEYKAGQYDKKHVFNDKMIVRIMNGGRSKIPYGSYLLNPSSF